MHLDNMNLAQEKKPLVTIGIPIYNAEKFLRNAIQSCINQTYENWELLLMCDGSTDNSNRIAAEMSELDSRIKVVNDSVNRGLVYRLNQSINIAHGKYYARMDADDVMEIHRIQKQVEFLEMNPQVDVVGSSTMLIDGNNNIIGSSLMSGNTSFAHPTVMGKTNWFQANPYDLSALRAEDFDLWNRTRKYSCFANIEKPLLFYRTIGMPTTMKLLKSYRTMCKLSLRYKEYGKKLQWCLKNYLIFLIKSAAIIFLSALNMQHIIIKHRKYIPLSNAELLTASDLELSIKNNRTI